MRPSPRETEDGFTVAAATWVMAITLVLVMMFANLLVHRYAQAVIRQATDEGARAAAIGGGSLEECSAVANDVVSDLIGGPLASGVQITCVDGGATVAATATVYLASLPPLSGSDFQTTSVVAKERFG